MKKQLGVTFSALALVGAMGIPTQSAAKSYSPYYYVDAATTQSVDVVHDNSPATALSTYSAPEPVATPTQKTTQPTVSGKPSVVTYYSNTVAPAATNIAPSPIPTYPAMPPVEPYIHKNTAPRDEPQGPRPEFTLGTRSGVDVALQVSNYHYREPSLDVSLAGEKGGVDVTTTGKFWTNNFVSFDFRYGLGTVDYSGSGRSSGNSEHLFDIRALVGRDFLGSWYGFSPYTGIGFRNLFSDERGLSSTGASGYRRENKSYYMPVGFTQRFMLSPRNHLSINGEYDYVFHGKQISYLDDLSGYPRVDNDQHHGNGFRTQIMWERPGWSIGPFANYWAMADSNLVDACGTAVCVTNGHEPHNNTIEAGLQLRVHALNF